MDRARTPSQLKDTSGGRKLTSASATKTPMRTQAEAPRVNVLGVGVSAINMQSAVDCICRALDDTRQGYVCVTGVHGVMEAQRDSGFRAILNSSLLTTPDGMPTVWVGRLGGFSTMRRVFGPDLMLEMCKVSVARGYTHFLYGGAPRVADELKTALENKFPGLQIVGTIRPRSGPSPATKKPRWPTA
jgi:N-acetylglucosaminyldiphosphoundecaprenol N-acetyl-beta-D-mannosaminyltransferase